MVYGIVGLAIWALAIPSGNLTYGYWKWPSWNSGYFPIKNGGSFQFAMLNYQRVNPIKPPFSYGFPMVSQWLPICIHPLVPPASLGDDSTVLYRRGFTKPWLMTAPGKKPLQLEVAFVDRVRCLQGLFDSVVSLSVPIHTNIIKHIYIYISNVVNHGKPW